MRRFLTTALLVAAAAALVLSRSRSKQAESGSKAAGDGVAFVSGGLDSALRRARTESKLVMVDVYTDWCGWCKKLDRDVYGDARVAAALKDVISVKVNAEKGGEEVARRYSVDGFPTILFLDSSGGLVRRVVGYVPAEEMVRIAKALPKSSA